MLQKVEKDTGHLFSGNLNILLSRNLTTYFLEIGLHSLWEAEHPLGNGTHYPLGIGPLFFWKLDRVSFGIQDILWETGHIILWESDHLFSGNWTAFPLGSGISSGKRDTLSSGNWTTYFLGIGPYFLWDP